MSGAEKVPPIDTDALYLRELESIHNAEVAQRIRREFLCAAVMRFAFGGMADQAWDEAEELFREGQRRGYLP